MIVSEKIKTYDYDILINSHYYLPIPFCLKAFFRQYFYFMKSNMLLPFAILFLLCV